MDTHSKKLKVFIDGLGKVVEEKVDFSGAKGKSEEDVFENRIVPVIREYLKGYFQKQDIADFEKETEKSFFYEGQKGRPIHATVKVFNSDSYPDAVILQPFKIAVEYKQAKSGARVKQCIGQSLVHFIADEYDCCFYLFWDKSENKAIKKSLNNEKERHLVETLWYQHRTALKVV